MMEYIMSHLLEIIGFLGTAVTAVFVFFRKFAQLEDRVMALETAVPREIARLERDLDKKFDDLREDLKEIQSDIKSLLRQSPR